MLSQLIVFAVVAAVFGASDDSILIELLRELGSRSVHGSGNWSASGSGGSGNWSAPGSGGHGNLSASGSAHFPHMLWTRTESGSGASGGEGACKESSCGTHSWCCDREECGHVTTGPFTCICEEPFSGQLCDKVCPILECRLKFGEAVGPLYQKARQQEHGSGSEPGSGDAQKGGLLAEDFPKCRKLAVEMFRCAKKADVCGGVCEHKDVAMAVLPPKIKKEVIRHICFVGQEDAQCSDELADCVKTCTPVYQAMDEEKFPSNYIDEVDACEQCLMTILKSEKQHNFASCGEAGRLFMQDVEMIPLTAAYQKDLSLGCPIEKISEECNLPDPAHPECGLGMKMKVRKAIKCMARKFKTQMTSCGNMLQVKEKATQYFIKQSKMICKVGDRVTDHLDKTCKRGL